VLARPIAWLALLAVLSGLAGATKLNGLALVGAGMALCAMLAWKSRTRLPGTQVAMFAAAGLILMPALTGAAFVGVNPYLYPSPVHRFELMVQHRNEAIRDQQAVFPTDAIPTGDIVRRVRMVPIGILRNVSPVEHGVMWVVMAALTLVGVTVLARQALQWWRDDQQSGMGMAILLVAGVMVGPALLTPLDWDRYYLPPVVLASLCTALSIPAGVAWFRGRR
jgi:hypothetical protein